MLTEFYVNLHCQAEAQTMLYMVAQIALLHSLVDHLGWWTGELQETARTDLNF